MKKLFLSLAVILGFGLYAYSLRPHHDEDQVIAPSSTSQTVTTTPTTGTASTPSPAPNPTVSTGQYKNGTYIGSVEDAFYGNVQVKVSINNGSIAEVAFLQYPNDRQNSVYINSQAMPYLKQEAIQVQNANVDIVSGATATSLAFRKSLATALAAAS